MRGRHFSLLCKSQIRGREEKQGRPRKSPPVNHRSLLRVEKDKSRQNLRPLAQPSNYIENGQGIWALQSLDSHAWGW